MVIYLVIGTYGEFDDFFQWPAKAFVDEKQAQVYVDILTNESLRIHRHEKKVLQIAEELYPLDRKPLIVKLRGEHVVDTEVKEKHNRVMNLRAEYIRKNKVKSEYFSDGDCDNYHPADFSVSEIDLVG